MRGSVTRTNPAWVAMVTLLAAFFGVGLGAVFSMPSLDDPMYLDGRLAPDPVLLWQGVLLAIGVMLTTAVLASLGAVRDPEVLDDGDRITVRLGWRSPFETHLWVGLFPGAVALGVWFLVFTNPVLVPSSVLVTGVGLLFAAALLYRAHGKRIRIDTLTLEGEMVEVDGHRFPRESITAVRWVGFDQRDRIIERSNGPPVRISMVGNRPQTRTMLTRVLLRKEDVALAETAVDQHLEPDRAHPLVMIVGWILGYPLGVLLGTLLLLDLVDGTGSLDPMRWTAATLLPSLLFGFLLEYRARRPSWVVSPESARWRPRPERWLVRGLLHTWVAWMLSTATAVGLMAELGGAPLAVLSLGALGGVLGWGQRFVRRRHRELELDAQGLVLTGRRRVRVPWSELVGVERREGLFPAVVLEVAGGETHLLPVGGALEDEIAEVVARIQAKMDQHDPATEDDRRDAVRATRLTREGS